MIRDNLTCASVFWRTESISITPFAISFRSVLLVLNRFLQFPVQNFKPTFLWADIARRCGWLQADFVAHLASIIVGLALL